jgi:DNA-binding FadR family transcriptional regulator
VATLGELDDCAREAIQRLAALGYVEARRGRTGARAHLVVWVPRPTTHPATLLPEVDRARRAHPVSRRALDRERLPSIADEDVGPDPRGARRLSAAGRPRGLRAADVAVHEAIAAATGNPYLASLSAQIRRQISLGFGAEPYSAEIRARAVKDHTALAEAVIGRRPGSAARVAERHFRLTETVLRELVSRISAMAGEA